jgi:hypothetical protein
MRLDEILKVSRQGMEPDQSGGSLEALWRDRMRFFANSFQKTLTDKEKRQLKHLAHTLKEHTKPVTAYVFDNWWKFACEVRALKGLECQPTQPHLGFLLKYCDIAGTLYLRSIEPPKSPAAVPPKAIPKMTEVSSPESEKPHILTVNELQELLADFKQ